MAPLGRTPRGSRFGIHDNHPLRKASFMTQTVASTPTQVRRGDGTSLVSAEDFAPRRHFIAGEFVTGASGDRKSVV